jgi:hypothetical protein
MVNENTTNDDDLESWEDSLVLLPAASAKKVFSLW